MLKDDVAAKLEKQRQRDIQAFGHAYTAENQRIISDDFETYHDLFKEALERDKVLYGAKKHLKELNTQELTLAALMAGVNALFEDRKKEKPKGKNPVAVLFANQLRHIGSEIYRLFYATKLKEWDAKQAAAMEERLRRLPTLAQRERALKKQAKARGFELAPWSDPDNLQVGVWVVGVLLQGPMFTIVELEEDDYKKPVRSLSLTEEAYSKLGPIYDLLLFSNAFLKPVTEEPEPWSKPYMHVEGFRFPFIRTHMKPVQKFVERKFKAGSYDPALEAINHAQSVRWRINEPILDLVRWAYETGVRIEKFPHKDDIPVPVLSKPWEELSNSERTLYSRDKRKADTKNRGLVADRIMLMTDLATADALRGQPFWTHLSLDWRGRVYPIPHFNFQRSDHVRAMFMFDQGQKLTRSGYDWLRVHVATTGAFEKIDKASFDERIQWVIDHHEDCLRVAEDPHGTVDWWSKADSPFMFVAACMALRDDMEGKPVHIPVSFDGSCSGLQHLCAMTRAPEGRLVNLTPSNYPNDIYANVAEEVRDAVTQDLDNPDKCELAQKWLDYGIGRSQVKRNVMTYAYSSKEFGMSGQINEDIMDKEEERVLRGFITKHPFEGCDRKAAFYFANHVYQAIKRVVQYPAGAMDFLVDIASQYAHESKPVFWNTPLGFPVMMLYPQMSKSRVKLMLYDKGIKTRIDANSSYDNYSHINKDKAKDAVAPNFVHSMDACHLMMVLLACKADGINSVALVHDSFGCLPNDAPRFRDIIRGTFRQMYEQHDVLEEFRQVALEILDDPSKVPPVPAKGTLDLSLIEKSDYCFA